jgi:hypothetical protein
MYDHVMSCYAKIGIRDKREILLSFPWPLPLIGCVTLGRLNCLSVKTVSLVKWEIYWKQSDT